MMLYQLRSLPIPRAPADGHCIPGVTSTSPTSMNSESHEPPNISTLLSKICVPADSDTHNLHHGSVAKVPVGTNHIETKKG
jgi:hypothetical protein